jgi:hypothetical protein
VEAESDKRLSRRGVTSSPSSWMFCILVSSGRGTCVRSEGFVVVPFDVDADVEADVDLEVEAYVTVLSVRKWLFFVGVCRL